MTNDDKLLRESVRLLNDLNALLEEWRAHARGFERIHGRDDHVAKALWACAGDLANVLSAVPAPFAASNAADHPSP